MTRIGVMKHLRLLEAAGLVVTRRSGREKLHYLNPVPIRLIHDRWIDKYTEHHASALADLKNEIGGTTMTTPHRPASIQMYRVYIKSPPEAIWEAITKPEWTVSTASPPWWNTSCGRAAPSGRMPTRGCWRSDVRT